MVLFVHCWYILIVLDTDNISHLLAWYYQFHLACILSLLFHLFLSLILSFVLSFPIFLWVSNRPLRCVKRFLGRRNGKASSSDLELFDLTSHFILSLTYADCDISFFFPFFHDISWHRAVLSTLQRSQSGYTAPLADQKKKAFRLYYTHFFHSFILSLSFSFPSSLLFFLLNAEFPARHHTMPIFHTKPSDFRLTNRICNIDDAIGHDMDLHMHMHIGTHAIIIESIIFSYPIDSWFKCWMLNAEWRIHATRSLKWK